MTVLETERLRLRPWKETDAESCYALAKDPDVGPMCGWLPHTSAEESKEIIEKILMVPETYAIERKEDHALLGNIAIMDEGSAAEIGCWLGKAYWRQGYMYEACRAVLHRVIIDLGKERAVWHYFTGNEASRRLAEKLGFRESGEPCMVHSDILGKDMERHEMVMDISWQRRARIIEENGQFSQQYQGYYGESDGTHTED